LVDDELFDRLNQLPWHVVKGYFRTSARTAKFRKLFPDWDGVANGVYLHQLVIGKRLLVDVDHRNGQTLDNRRSNLRPATRSQNIGNSASNVGTSKFKGVYFSARDGRANVWVAEITLSRVKRYLGAFVLEKDAAKAYDRAAFQAFGPYARFNFPLDEQKKEMLPNPKRSGQHPYTGVRPQNSSFSARADVIHLGMFDTAYEAALYRDYYIEKHNLNLRMNF
jgi:hypothetical protein